MKGFIFEESTRQQQGSSKLPNNIDQRSTEETERQDRRHRDLRRRRKRKYNSKERRNKTDLNWQLTLKRPSRKLEIRLLRKYFQKIRGSNGEMK